MSNKSPLVCALLGTMLTLSSCIDDNFLNFGYDPNSVQLEIMLSLPGESLAATRAVSTRVGGDNQTYTDLDYNTAPQYYIGTNDVYALVYKVEDADTTLYAVPSMTLGGSNGDQTRTASGAIDRPSEEITITVDVIANLVQNGYASSVAVARTQLQSLIGQTREYVDEAIGTFTYPTYEDNDYAGWALEVKDGEGHTTSTRYLPMWGKGSTTCTITSDTEVADCGTCNLYRSVAKMGVMVDEECNTFELKEVYIYYLNEDGKYVSSKTPDASLNVQYTYPDVPSTTQRTKQEPLIYRLDDYKVTWNAFLNQIYVTETDNKEGAQPMVMVVGGYYKGGDYEGEGLVDGTSADDKYTLNYYRIDMEDNGADNPNGGSGPFDIIRNHSYIFNIKECNNPGTSDPNPDYAAAGLTVEVLDYVDMPMHGINAQYTLTVNQSLFSFSGATTAVGNLIVSTDGTGWELVTEWTESEGYPSDGTVPSWIELTEQEGGHTNVNDTVYIAVDANVNNEDMRSGSFWIKCGRVLKEIHLVQDYEETGNGYIVTSAGTYDLKVNIRGNGNNKAWTDEKGETDAEKIDFDMGTDIDDVAYVGIIWETANHFVTIPDPYAISQSGSIEYVVNNVSLSDFGDWTGNVFDKGNGANALIGVFDSKDSLVWSYHIWGVGDFIDGVPMEKWRVGLSTSSLNYYEFMDRNLGAYSNLPGSKSFGLLYQWGRKDPFIGAYREAGTNGTYERDFRQVRKQHTVHYEQKNGKYYLWGNHDDSGTMEENDVKYTISNPTTILEDGLLSDDHDNDVAHGLWGTTSYEYVNAETGNKTMYDPCPPGYRMPSLNALSIWDGYNNLWSSGTHSSLSCRFVPVPEPDSDSGEIDYSTEDFRTGNGHAADFVSGAPFYGFWLDYANGYGFTSRVDTTETTQGGSTVITYALPDDAYDVVYYSDATVKDGTYGWVTKGSTVFKDQSPEGLTWIPMAGIYNGTMECFGRAGLSDLSPEAGGGGGPGGDGQGGGGPGTGGNTGGTTGPPVRRKAKASSEGYLPSSSLEVTSVLWANSPTPQHTNYPAGLLIHGTEGAYAPHQGGTTAGDPYWYSPGTADGKGSGDAKDTMVATEGKGYWTTDASGYSATASGWWTGSVDAGNSSMDKSITKGQWNGDNAITSYTSWDDENGFSESGRHFHSYMEDNASVYANPSYAASVRCIKDKDALTYTTDRILDIDGENYDGAALDLYHDSYTDGPADCIEMIVSYVQGWEVTNPGAKWVSVSPTSGSSSNLSGDNSTIKISYLEDYLPTNTPATAAITIKFARGGTATINVQYVGGIRGAN